MSISFSEVNFHNNKIMEAIISLGNNAFGKDYFSIDKIAALFEKDIAFYVANTTEGICGYCLFYLSEGGELVDEMKLTEGDMKLMNNFLSCKREEQIFCCAKSMAVSKEYRGKGIAEELFRLCFEKSILLGANVFLGSAWKIGDKVPMHKIFIANGFKKIKQVPLIWFDDNQYICNVCNGRCQCTGVIYAKIL